MPRPESDRPAKWLMDTERTIDHPSEWCRDRTQIEAKWATYRDLILDAGDVEEGLDLGPQLVPRPGAELQVLAQVALDNLEGQALLLQLEEVLTGQVSSDPGLHPRHDLAQTLVTQLLHLTQHSGTEEHLREDWWPIRRGP